MTKHSAVLPTVQHLQAVYNALPGNPSLASAVVMIHDVSFDDASKIAAQVAAFGLSPLDWDPPITQAPVTKSTAPIAEPVQEPTLPDTPPPA